MDTSIRGLPNDWRRRPGRPRHTCLRTLEADLQPLNRGLSSARRLAQEDIVGHESHVYIALN